MDGKTLYIFIDESGNFDFSPTGSPYWILTSLTTLDPMKGREAIERLRYSLWQKGKDIECFHATEDKQEIRDQVYDTIKGLDGFEFDSVIAEKRKTHISLYTKAEIIQKGPFGILKRTVAHERFYKQICETLLQYIIRRHAGNKEIENIIVVLDYMLTHNQREYVKKHIKTYMKANFERVPHVYFHQTKADPNSQIADYLCWAVSVKWTRKEMRPYDVVKEKITSEFEIFRNGTKLYY